MQCGGRDLDQFTLELHGDTQEKRHFRFLLDMVPYYESFWRRHIVPLTYRMVDPKLRYVRPSLGREAKALANTSYAVMYHLTWCDEYRRRIIELEQSDRVGRTENLYCYWTHASSMLDALGHFAFAVDQICSDDLPFGAKYVDRKYWRFTRLETKRKPSTDLYNELRAIVGAYRNHLVHDCPVYILNNYMPSKNVLEQSSRRGYSGLAALAEAVKRGTSIATAYVKIDETLAHVMQLLANVGGDWYGVAGQALGDMPDDMYERLQLQGLNEDARISREQFEAFLGDRIR